VTQVDGLGSTEEVAARIDEACAPLFSADCSDVAS